MKRIFWLVLILFVVFAAGLSVITANAAPAGNTTLSAGQKLTIKANGCNLKVKKETTSSVVVVCKASANAKSELAPDAKVTLTAGQKQKVSANGCSLSVTKKTASVVKVKCVGTGSPTATRTATTTQGTATRTPTRTQTPTATATQPTGNTYRVSIGSNGEQGNQEVGASDISADGRYMAFDSYANTLVSDDNNWNCDTIYGENCSDVFVHDIQTGETTLVSRASDGTQGNSSSHKPSISADGRYVAFQSDSSNLTSGDTNGLGDVFVHDRQTGETSIASVKSDGSQGIYYGATNPHISADGRYVQFQTYTNELGCPITDYFQVDFLYVHDVQTGTTTCVSVTSTGDGLDGAEGYSVSATNASISGNGRYVAFSSNANNLVSGETKFPCNVTQTQTVEHCVDVYVHDMQTGTTTRVSVDPDGINGSDDPGGTMTALSNDGRYVMFDSFASNLTDDDNNICVPAPSCLDVFVYDTQTGTTTLVSRKENGSQFNSSVFGADISADGRYFTFTAGGGFNWSAYVHDRQTGTTTEYSLRNNGTPTGVNANASSLSSDGRYALFTTKDDTIVSGDTNECYDPRGFGSWGPCMDLFVRERW